MAYLLHVEAAVAKNSDYHPLSFPHDLANRQLYGFKSPLCTGGEKCVNVLSGAQSSVVRLEMEKAGMQSKRLAVMDDHTDLHIFETQPHSLGSPCLTAMLHA